MHTLFPRGRGKARVTFCVRVYSVQHYASRSGHSDVCLLLLSSGASVNIQTPGGVTPLHRAAYCGHEGVVTVLLEGGAKVMLVDSDGRTALHKVLVSFSPKRKCLGGLGGHEHTKPVLAGTTRKYTGRYGCR